MSMLTLLTAYLIAIGCKGDSSGNHHVVPSSNHYHTSDGGGFIINSGQSVFINGVPQSEPNSVRFVVPNGPTVLVTSNTQSVFSNQVPSFGLGGNVGLQNGLLGVPVQNGPSGRLGLGNLLREVHGLRHGDDDTSRVDTSSRRTVVVNNPEPEKYHVYRSYHEPRPEPEKTVYPSYTRPEPEKTVYPSYTRPEPERNVYSSYSRPEPERTVYRSYPRPEPNRAVYLSHPRSEPEKTHPKPEPEKHTVVGAEPHDYLRIINSYDNLQRLRHQPSYYTGYHGLQSTPWAHRTGIRPSHVGKGLRY